MTLYSFGQRHHRRPPARIVFTCLHLPNPHAKYGNLDGRDKPVKDYIRGYLARPDLARWWKGIHDTILGVATPLIYHPAELAKLGFAFQCFGGRHRSVACAELMAEELRGEGWHVSTSHLEL